MEYTKACLIDSIPENNMVKALNKPSNAIKEMKRPSMNPGDRIFLVRELIQKDQYDKICVNRYRNPVQDDSLDILASRLASEGDAFVHGKFHGSKAQNAAEDERKVPEKALELNSKVLKSCTEFLLKSLQVTGVTWIIAQEKIAIKCGILADSCGLGKTITSLTPIHRSSVLARYDRRLRFQANSHSMPCASNRRMVRKNTGPFGNSLTVYIYHGNRFHTSDPTRKVRMVNRDEFNDKLASLAGTDR